MTDLALIKFEGKALEKLVETVSKGIGTLYKPVAIRKEAKAKAFEHLVMERAKTQALTESSPEEFEEIHCIERSIYGRERRRQKNIGKVIQIAAEQLDSNDEISNTPVNEDWATRFFNIVGDVSDEYVQTLWGKILAGEVKKPNSFSLRTLELLKNLTSEEAELFTKLSEFAIGAFGEIHVFYNNKEFLDNETSITFTDLLLLNEIGLLKSNFTLGISFIIPKNIKSFPVKYRDKCIIYENSSDQEKEVSYRCIAYTSIGAELLKLIEPKSNIKYLQEIKKHCQSQFIKVRMADLHSVPHGFEGKNEREIPD